MADLYIKCLSCRGIGTLPVYVGDVDTVDCRDCEGTGYQIFYKEEGDVVDVEYKIIQTTDDIPLSRAIVKKS